MGSGIARAQAVFQAELERVDAELIGQLIDGLFYAE